MAIDFSPLEALSTLWKSILEWNARPGEFNGQIAKRQIEIARLTERNAHQPDHWKKNPLD
jgi:hypothetical protein